MSLLAALRAAEASLRRGMKIHSLPRGNRRPNYVTDFSEHDTLCLRGNSTIFFGNPASFFLLPPRIAVDYHTIPTWKKCHCSEKSVHNSNSKVRVPIPPRDGEWIFMPLRREASRRRAAGNLTSSQKAVTLISRPSFLLQQQQQGKSQSPWDALEAIIES